MSVASNWIAPSKSSAPVAERVVKLPAAGVVPPMTLESMTAPSMLMATLVPVELKMASIVSRSVLSFVPQVSVAKNVIVNLFMIYFL